MEKMLQGPFKKMMNKQIDNNSWMNKLIEFYKEEMGSDSGSSDNSSASGASSDGSVSDDGAGKLSSAKSSLESLADIGSSDHMERKKSKKK